MTVSTWISEDGQYSVDADLIARCLIESNPGDAWWLDGGSIEPGYFAFDPAFRVESRGLDGLVKWQELRRMYPDLFWTGYISYDAAADFLLGRQVHASSIPGVVLRGFRSAMMLSPRGGLTHLGSGCLPNWMRKDRPRHTLGVSANWMPRTAHSLWTPEIYARKFDAVHREIRAGNSYQINLSQKFCAPWNQIAQSTLAERSVGYYLSLRERAPARLGACFGLPTGAWALSNSPETLLEVRKTQAGRIARSMPIKGTRPRGSDDLTDRALVDELRRSSKDAAEHVMIVDLVRNDLGRVCQPGTVRADRTPTCVTLPTVHHLVSTVEGLLSNDATMLDLILSVIPGGSITGAPKRRTIEIIGELEAECRELYCGAIMWAKGDELTASIPIRTAIAQNDAIYLRSGGGIVIDSVAEDERLETLAKAAAFLKSTLQS